MTNDSRVKVSVIIPVYNAEKHLRECLDSVAGQSLREIEIICVDDGSTDASLRILEEYAAKDSRFRILHQKNQFAGVARNNGMKIARGKYLSFLDSDDFFEAAMLEKMVRRAEDADAEIVVCDFWEFAGINSPENKKREIGVSRNFFAKRKLRCKHVFSFKDALKSVSIERFALAPWNKLFRREFIDSIGNKFSNTRIANDLAFVAFALFLAERIAIISVPFVYYRQTVKNSITATRGLHLENNLIAWKDLRERLLIQNAYGKVQKNFLKAFANSLAYELSQNPSKEFLDEICREFPELPASYRRRIERKAFPQRER